jgi:hypothetical protein
MDLMRMRWQAINESLDAVRTNSSREQNQILFNDLVSLKRNLMNPDTPLQCSEKTNNFDETYFQTSHSIDSAYNEQKESAEYSSRKIFEVTKLRELNSQEDPHDKQQQLESSSESSHNADYQNLGTKSKRNMKGERSPLTAMDMNMVKVKKHRWPNCSKNQARRKLRITQKNKRI